MNEPWLSMLYGVSMTREINVVDRHLMGSLADLMDKSQISQLELSRRSGVAATAINRILKGKQGATTAMWSKLIEAAQ